MINLNTPKATIFWAKLKGTIYEKYGRESGKMLVHAGLITWITSAVSQVVAVALNDKISPDQKKFLIPQEVADGALNVLAFYCITNTGKNIAGKLVSTGKWSTKAIRDFVEKNPLAKNIKMGDMSTNLGKTFRDNEEFHECYDKFKGGMDMFSAVVGAVASSNIITPIIRNRIGAEKQKDSIAKDKMQKRTTLPMQNRINTNGSMKI